MHRLVATNELPSSQTSALCSEVHDPANKTPLPDPGVGWPASLSEYDTILFGGEPLPGESAHISGMRRYSRSKLCNVLFTHELAHRLSGAAPAATRAPGGSSCSLPAARSLRVLAFNPGLMLDTNFVTASTGRVIGWLAAALRPLLLLTSLSRLLRTGPQSGAVLAQIAMGEVGAGANAAYFDGPAQKPSSDFSLSAEGAAARRAVWEYSLRWAAVTKDELEQAGMAKQ